MMQKRPMIKHSKQITGDDDVYTRRYTAPLKGGGTPSFFVWRRNICEN